MSRSSSRHSSPKTRYSLHKTRSLGNASQDIKLGFARKTPRSYLRDNRKKQHEMTQEFSKVKALKMAELAAGLYELDEIYKELKLAQDKKDLREIQEMWANNEDPDLDLLENNIQFWSEKTGFTRTKSGGRKHGRRKSFVRKSFVRKSFGRKSFGRKTRKH